LFPLRRDVGLGFEGVSVVSFLCGKDAICCTFDKDVHNFLANAVGEVYARVLKNLPAFSVKMIQIKISSLMAEFFWKRRYH